jgi:hypothetical protein
MVTCKVYFEDLDFYIMTLSELCPKWISLLTSVKKLLQWALSEMDLHIILFVWHMVNICLKNSLNKM